MLQYCYCVEEATVARQSTNAAQDADQRQNGSGGQNVRVVLVVEEKHVRVGLLER